MVFAIPPPRPPKVKEGLIIAGSPIFFKHFDASENLFIISDLGRSIPISDIFLRNFFLSSAFAIAEDFAPISSILYFFSSPDFSAFIARLRAVCPPIVGNIASGFSFFKISSRTSIVIGSI